MARYVSISSLKPICRAADCDLPNVEISTSPNPIPRIPELSYKYNKEITKFHNNVMKKLRVKSCHK